MQAYRSERHRPLDRRYQYPVLSGARRCLVARRSGAPGRGEDELALKDRPGQPLMIEIAEVWRPWRAVAARMLWSYYALRRKPLDAPA